MSAIRAGGTLDKPVRFLGPTLEKMPRYGFMPLALGYHGPNVERFLELTTLDHRFAHSWVRAVRPSA